MNKKQLTNQELENNNQSFGRWRSTQQRNSADRGKLLYEAPPQNEEEALQHGNALANTGNYPVGTSECFNVGISGGCGLGCFVYLKGECGDPQEMVEQIEGDDELKRHADLYG